jgi:hypothetical protein
MGADRDGTAVGSQVVPASFHGGGFHGGYGGFYGDRGGWGWNL